jgi:hypothetical protein
MLTIRGLADRRAVMKRCEGVVVKEVRGLNKNVRCPEEATVERQLLTTVKGKPKTFHYCAKCVTYWDRQQAIVGGLLRDG